MEKLDKFIRSRTQGVLGLHNQYALRGNYDRIAACYKQSASRQTSKAKAKDPKDQQNNASNSKTPTGNAPNSNAPNSDAPNSNMPKVDTPNSNMPKVNTPNS